MPAAEVPAERIRLANASPLRPDGDYVLYWMVAYRRTTWNFSLQHAVHLAEQLGKPLLVFEPLRVRYGWASDRFHRFVIEGMRDNAAALAKQPVTYFPYVEPRPGAGTPLLHRLAERACAVVSDDYPCFFLPTMFCAVADRLPVAFHLVDSNGLVPLQSADRTFTVSHSYRRWVQKRVLSLLQHFPMPDPLQKVALPRLAELPSEIQRRWPAADISALLKPGGLDSIPIDHTVAPVEMCGGASAAESRLQSFLNQQLLVYDEQRNHPDEQGSSTLSPYLHFGHISPHELVSRTLDAQSWNPSRLRAPNGKSHNFWGLSNSVEGFLDQVITWREMGFNMCSRHPDSYDQYETLPKWAIDSLKRHERDPRPAIYTLEQLDRAETGDAVWNAAQRQLVQEGRMHNYMRMLWGKLVLQWTPTPKDAMQILIELNNRYALDGRDPNSYSGIFWIFGRYDRAWGPERPIYGMVRYMTSDSARRKLRLKEYLQRYAA